MVEIKLVRGQQTLLNQKYVDVSTNPHFLKEIAPGIPGLEQNLVIPSYDSKLKSVFFLNVLGENRFTQKFTKTASLISFISIFNGAIFVNFWVKESTFFKKIDFSGFFLLLL